MTEMAAASYQKCAQVVQVLSSALHDLEQHHRLLQLPQLEGREWYDSLQQKLLPQLHDDAFLVVAVVGGTNIGKSVVFNHLAGCRASATSPLASGTKHPVCLVPPGFEESHNLEEIFRGFELHRWSDSDAALEEHGEDRLFWRTSESTPDNLLVLDTPDIDSDAPVNWERAEHIRRCADVLIAILTQQKYNDAAVKKFFRQAAQEEKAILAVFNQVHLPEDEHIWPVWLKTFCSETGIAPELVYLAPYDRRSAESNQLPFYQRPWPVESPRKHPPDNTPHSLQAELSQLHFSRIKLQTLSGSLKLLLDLEHGVPAYLREVSGQSERFHHAAEKLTTKGFLEFDDWPPVPASEAAEEMRRWWMLHQQAWAQNVHAFYRSVLDGATWPYRAIRNRVQGEPQKPLEQYREREWQTIVSITQEVYEKLTWMTQSGSELLKPRFEQLMQGHSREALIQTLRQQHGMVNLEEELTRVVHEEMKNFQQEHPKFFKFYQQFQHVTAAARPAISIGLFAFGAGPLGEAMVPALAHLSTHIVADIAGGAALTATGETALGAAGSGMTLLQTKLRNLQTTFATRRVRWLAELLHEHLLGDLPADLQRASTLSSSPQYQRVQEILQQLRREIEPLG